MDLVGQRKENGEKLILAAFQRRMLQKHADKINEKQNAKMPKFSDSSNASRTFTVDDDTMIYQHKGLLRMVEMKRLTKPRKTEKYKRKKTYDIHNRIIMGHFGQLGRDLTFGLSDSIRDEIIAELDGKTI